MLLRLCTIIYWLALVFWVSGLITATISAAHVFGTLTELPLVLTEYPAYPADTHGTIAAGQIMERIFFTVDLIQFIAAPLVLITLLAQLLLDRASRRRAWTVLRGITILGAVCLLAYHATRVAPPLNREIRQWWEVARAGDIEQAAQHRQIIDPLHRRAVWILQVNLGLLLLTTTMSAAGLSQPPARGRTSSLPIPDLARTHRR